MTKAIAILFVVCLLAGCMTGCATYKASQLPNPTQEQIAAAECSDAKDVMLAADLALALSNLSAQQREDWTKRRVAAQAVVDRYCGATK
ncbi:MAG: hypothetical protein ABFD97_20340 [Syntrophobacter sp.]